MSPDIRVYVADLAAYNAGTLRGCWIELDGKAAEDIAEEINAMLLTSPESNVMRAVCGYCGHVHGRPLADVGDRCDNCGERGLADVPSAEEWRIDDSEGAGSLIGKYSSVAELAAISERAAEMHDAEEWAAFIAYSENFGRWGLSSVDDFRDAYRGQWDDLEAYAVDFVDSCGYLDTAPDFLARYFDFAAFARDMELGGDVWTAPAPDGGIFVFDAN